MLTKQNLNDSARYHTQSLFCGYNNQPNSPVHAYQLLRSPMHTSLNLNNTFESWNSRYGIDADPSSPATGLSPVIGKSFSFRQLPMLTLENPFSKQQPAFTNSCLQCHQKVEKHFNTQLEIPMFRCSE